MALKAARRGIRLRTKGHSTQFRGRGGELAHAGLVALEQGLISGLFSAQGKEAVRIDVARFELEHELK